MLESELEEKGYFFMLKVVVFDSGFGGELFENTVKDEHIESYKTFMVKISDKCKELGKTLDIIMVSPYIGRVDLIVFANYLISTTSLNYFRKKYKRQKFAGFHLSPRRIKSEKCTLILTTTATTKNFTFFHYAHRIKAKTICLDHWPLLIDDGELTKEEFEKDIKTAMNSFRNFSPQQILLACGQFSELTPELRRIFGHNVRIVDSFDDTVHDVFKILHLHTIKQD